MSHGHLFPSLPGDSGGGSGISQRGIPCRYCVLSVRERVYRVFEQKSFVIDARQTDFVEVMRDDTMPHRPECTEIATCSLPVIQHVHVLFVSDFINSVNFVRFSHENCTNFTRFLHENRANFTRFLHQNCTKFARFGVYLINILW